MTSTSSKRLYVLVGFLALSALVAALGGWSTASSLKDWYAGLHKPGFNPPGWVFGPVWTVLYILMAVAAWRAWCAPASSLRTAGLRLYLLQLALNLAWSLIFFGARRPGAALIDIAALFAAVCATTWAFSRVSKPAGLLMLPYAAWVAFAAVLNFEVWRLN